MKEYNRNFKLGYLFFKRWKRGEKEYIHQAIHYLTEALEKDNDFSSCLYLGNICSDIGVDEWAQDYWYKGAMYGDSYSMNNLAIEYVKRNDELTSLFLFLLAGNETALKNARELIVDFDVPDRVLNLLDAKLESLPDESDSSETLKIELEEPGEDD